MQQDLSDFKFQYGLSLSNSRVYIFTNSKNQILTISEKVGKFINGDTTDYVLFQIDYGNGIISNDYVYRKSEEFLNLINIRPIVDNLNGIVEICKNCGHIVLSEHIRSSNADKCIYCDKYLCRKCRKLYPLVELDENRLCSRCRRENEN